MNLALFRSQQTHTQTIDNLLIFTPREPPAGAGGDSRSGGESTDAGGRPQPPPVPTTTKTPIRQQVTISTASFSNTPKSPKSPEPKTQPSTVVYVCYACMELHVSLRAHNLSLE